MSDRPIETIAIRVYYEDTDLSARVYHASYLRFLERGRTEWLRCLGFTHGESVDASGVLFAVRILHIEYLAPALIDDLLQIETRVIEVQGASVNFEQIIFRRHEQLATANVLVVTIRDGRPARIPQPLRRALFEFFAAPRAINQEGRGSNERSKRAASDSIRSPNRSSRSRISARFGSAPMVSRRR
jgi:acyl-CoA thioester hydrolase